jgi:hypothetical protein
VLLSGNTLYSSLIVTAEHSKKEAGISLNQHAFSLITAVFFFVYRKIAIYPLQKKKEEYFPLIDHNEEDISVGKEVKEA